MTVAALFDWDGTLLDSREALLAAWHASTAAVAGRRYPASPAEEELVFTRPGLELFGALMGDDPRRTRELVAAFEAAYEDNGSRVRPFPGIVRMLGELRDAGVAIGVVTSKARRRYVADARHAGLQGLIDAAACAEDTQAHKPDPGPVLAVLAELGISADRAVMTGDTPVDVLAGLAAGTAALGVAWGAAGTAPLLAAGAGAVAVEAAELARLVLSADHYDSRRVTPS